MLTSETIIKKLTKYGLSTDEAEIYIQLLLMGPSPAGALSKAIKINRMKAYRTLKRLEEKGFVETIIERPLRFSAKPLEELIGGFMEKERERLESLEITSKELETEWDNLREYHETPDTGPKFRILGGRRQVMEQIAQVCARAERSIFLMTTQNDLFRLSYSGLTETLTELSGKGVEIRILSHITGLDVDIGEYFGVSEMRHTTFPATMRFVIVDEREALTTFTMDDSMSMTTKDDLGLWIDAPDYVKAISSSMDAIWDDSVPASDVISELKQTNAMKGVMANIMASFEEEGWTVELPGTISIDESLEYKFDMVAKPLGEPEKRVLIDLATEEGELMNRILLLYAKSMSVEAEKRIIITTEPYDDRTKNLADLYSIILMNVDEVKDDFLSSIDVTH